MRRPVLFSGMVCLLFLSGCLGSVFDEDIETVLNVEANTERVTIETIYEQGELSSSSTETIEFDFSGSTSVVSIRTFGLITDDGRSFSIDASEETTIALDFDHHGMYEIVLYAIDSEKNNVTTTKTILVEQIIRWTEEGTGDPQSLFFDARPGNDGNAPSYVMLNSTVANPSPFLELNGRDVDVEWAVLNVEGQCMGNREIVENGGSVTWNTLHFAPIDMHEIEMTIHEGQDEINIEHVVALRYSE
ncbi:MAG: hypothetical protein VXW14_07060 [Candidatus Thermoplasmatota archaeon]|nr:hypothetical protein [Candidatus Thermoplasmatota archaeon]